MSRSLDCLSVDCLANRTRGSYVRLSRDERLTFERALGGVAVCVRLAKYGDEFGFRDMATGECEALIDADISELKEAWQATLRW